MFKNVEQRFSRPNARQSVPSGPDPLVTAHDKIDGLKAENITLSVENEAMASSLKSVTEKLWEAESQIKELKETNEALVKDCAKVNVVGDVADLKTLEEPAEKPKKTRKKKAPKKEASE